MIYLTIPLTLLAPIIPWVGLLSWELGRHFSRTRLVVLFVTGVMLDLWWGKPFGATAVILVGLALAVYWGQRLWPANSQIFSIISLIGAVVVMEIFLRL